MYGGGLDEDLIPARSAGHAERFEIVPHGFEAVAFLPADVGKAPKMGGGSGKRRKGGEREGLVGEIRKVAFEPRKSVYVSAVCKDAFFTIFHSDAPSLQEVQELQIGLLCGKADVPHTDAPPEEGEHVEITGARNIGGYGVLLRGTDGGDGDLIAHALDLPAEGLDDGASRLNIASLRPSARETKFHAAAERRRKQHAARVLRARIGGNFYGAAEPLRGHEEGEVVFSQKLKCHARTREICAKFHRTPAHLGACVQGKSPAERGEYGREEACRSPRIPDVHPSILRGRDPMDAQPVGFLIRDAERTEGAEKVARVLRIVAAEKVHILCGKGGKEDRTVQNALGSGYRDLYGLQGERSYTIMFHTKSILDFPSDVKKIRAGGLAMNYTVIRKKRKMLTLKLDEAGNAVVLAPLNVSAKRIEEFVSEHLSWIQKKQAEYAALPRFCDGDTIELCGKMLTICSGTRAKVEKNLLILPEEGRSKALIGLLKRITRARMAEFLLELCRSYGFSYEKMRVTAARGRWGSCSAKGTISFSFRTAFLPDALARYLAVHELCHTRHLDHSAAFWDEVGSILPDWKIRRHALKQYLWAMRCL